MPTQRPDGSPLKALAAAGLACLLVVVAASAAIRLEWGFIPAFRIVHRAAASLEVLAVLWIGWEAWRGRREHPRLAMAAALALALTVALSAIGIASGQHPSRPAALANLLGGLALASTFAWLLGAVRGRGAALAAALAALMGALLGSQALIGARLSIFGRTELPALPAHALLGIVTAALTAWIALARIRGASGRLLFACALLAPTAGFTALQYDYSRGAALMHAIAVALLVAAAAYVIGRNA